MNDRQETSIPCDEQTFPAARPPGLPRRHGAVLREARTFDGSSTTTARTAEPALRILLVDDHLLVREGLRRIIESSGEGWVVCEAASGFQALDLMRLQSFDLVVADLSMPGLSGLELTRRIKADFPQQAVLILSMHAEEAYSLRSFQAGAGGYLTKDSAAPDLLAAIRKVGTGGTYVTPALAERVVRQLNGTVGVAPHSRLSDRELDVLRRMVRGQRLVEIARALNLSIKTISTHKSRIQDKLKLPGFAALIRYGMDHRLHLGPDDIDPADTGAAALPSQAVGP